MSKRLSLISAFVCCLIWGTTFIAQDTGMDEIGPFTFNGVRFSYLENSLKKYEHKF